MLSRIKQQDVTAALGLSNFLRTIAATLGTAVTVTLWDLRSQFHYASIAPTVNISDDLKVYSTPTSIEGELSQRLAMIVDIVNTESLTLAINDVYTLFALLFLLLSLLTLLIRPSE